MKDRELRAPEGYYYSDGTNMGKVIYVADGVNKKNYYLITEEEYNQIMIEKQ